MATRLQKLLGLAPLENLRGRRQNQPNMSGQNLFGLERPIDTNFEQIGNQTLAPIRTQSPVQQDYFNSQMSNMGLQNPANMSLGPDDPEEGDQGSAGPSTDVPEGAGPSDSPGTSRFTTDPENLLRSALSALPPSQAAQYQKFLSDGELDIQEIGALAGFDFSKIEPGNKLYMALENAGAGRFRDALANLTGELANAQELRSDLFGQTLEGASREAGSLLGMADAGSTSGLVSGRRAGQQQEATNVLENALSRQLLADESTYLGEVDSIISGSIGQLQDDLAGLLESVLSAQPDLGVFAIGGTGANVEDYPGYLQSTIDSLGLSENEMAQVNSYIRGYFDQFGDYPSSEVFNTWYQSTFGDEQQQDEE